MEINKDIIKSIKIKPLLDTLQLEDISDDVYFSNKFKNYISNSRLGKLIKEGAEAFFKNEPSPYNPSFEFGTLLHTMVLEPEDHEVIKDVFKPTAKAGLMADALYKSDGTNPSNDEIKAQSYIIGYYKDKLTPTRIVEFRNKAELYWRDRYIYEQNNPFKEGDKKRIYTNEGNYNLLVECLKQLDSNVNIQKLLHPEGITEEPYVANEHAILMDVEIEIPEYESRIYHLKAKLDNFTIDRESNVITVNDLKTTSRPLPYFDLEYFSYQREIAFYSFLLKLCAKKFFDLPSPEVKGNFLVVSTVPDYSTTIVPMTSKLYNQGWKEVTYLLKVVAYFNIVEGHEFCS